MQDRIKIALTVILLLGNIASGVCLAVFFWLAGVWMVDDSLAAQLTPAGWIGIAVNRAAIGLCVALVIGFLFGVANTRACANMFPERARPHWLLTGVIGWLIALGAIAGSIQFTIQRPYM